VAELPQFLKKLQVGQSGEEMATFDSGLTAELVLQTKLQTNHTT
jgi:hypothetical protein